MKRPGAAGQRWTHGAGRRLSDETGSILPLVFFYAFLCLVLVLLVSAITSLYLARERLFAVADGAALAGAEAYDLEEVTVVGGRPRAVLESSAVREAVSEYLSTSVADGLDALTVEQAQSGDGRSATVRLSAVWHPPLVSALVPAGLRIDVTSTARSVFW